MTGTGETVNTELVVAGLPALSVTVRLTVTLPVPVGSSVAVDAFVALVRVASVAPPVMLHL